MKDVDIDKLLEKAFEELAKIEYEQRPTNLPQHKFSLRFHCKMYWSLWKARRRKAKKRKKLILEDRDKALTVLYRPLQHKKRLALALVLLLFTGSVALSADSVFHFIFDRAIKRQNDHMGVVYQEWEEHAKEEFQKYEITDIPDGYYLEREEYNDEFQIYFLLYRNKNGHILHLNQSWQEGGMLGNVTSDTKKVEDVKIKDYPGYYVSDGDINTLVFSDGIYILELSGELSKEKMIEIAESLKLKEI
ncbi:DUF4367 domain-containing protein [Lachnospiraceae bacterium 29-84]